MANRNFIESNSLIKMAVNLNNFLNKDYLENIQNRILTSENDILLESFVFYKINSYRSVGRTDDNLNVIQNSMNSFLGSSYSTYYPFLFVVSKNEGYVEIFFGCHPSLANMFKRSILGTINSIELKNEFIDQKLLKIIGAKGGIVTGLPHKNLLLDNILNGFTNLQNGIIMNICMPYERKHIDLSTVKLDQLKMMYSPLSKQVRTYGISNRFNMEVVNQDVDILLKSIDKLETRLNEAKSEGLWRVCTWVCSNTVEEAKDISSIYIGEISKNEENEVRNEKYHFIETSATPFSLGKVFIPYISTSVPSILNEEIFNSGLSSVMTKQNLKQIITLPNFSWPGFLVKNHDKQIDDKAMFEVNAPESKTGESIRIGKICNSVMDLRINLKDIVSHVGIFGINGFGKTNTSHVLLKELENNKIPYLVIEPVKKDYWRMNEFAKTQIYSAGGDGIKLEFNPMQPAPDISIGNHIERLIVAFSSQSDFYSPLPEVMRLLLVSVYKQYGFEPEDLILKQEIRSFPTLKDVLNNASSFVDNDTEYTEKLKTDIKGALNIRLTTILKGTPGTVFNSIVPLNLKSILEKSTIIELNELDGDAKNFAMAMIICLIDEYVRNKPEQNSLKCAIVLEEAHRFFSKSMSNVEINSKDLISDYYSDLLSEVRSHGYGIIIVDQRPSILDSNAISNTVVKIVHALANDEDVNAISYSLNLNELQKKGLRDLKRGEAIVGIIGHTQVCKVLVDYLPNTEKPLFSCLLCKKEVCNFSLVQNKYKFEIQQILKEASNIKLEELNEIKIKNWISYKILDTFPDESFTDFVCVSGQIIMALNFSNKEKRRLIKLLVEGKEGEYYAF